MKSGWMMCNGGHVFGLFLAVGKRLKSGWMMCNGEHVFGLFLKSYEEIALNSGLLGGHVLD